MKSCFVFLSWKKKKSPFPPDEPASACVALTAAVFASVTASRWRSLFSSPASLAFPYSPVARLSPYSNGISTPSSSKTSNKAILTPERTGNISIPDQLLALLLSHETGHTRPSAVGKPEGDLVSERLCCTLPLCTESACVRPCACSLLG